MDRTQAERLITAHAKSIFGFALKRCARIQDAEDVAQEIALRAYQALLPREDVTDPVRYIWTVAHNVLANHYRERSRLHVGVPDASTVETDPESVLLDKEVIDHLRREIACLSRIQREIVVAYYFHGHKQQDIAAQMKLPLGTVKWHLFEARKELKRNMETNRSISHLTFDPIRFTNFSVSGSLGADGSPWRVLHGVLAQNIAYACWKTPRSISEIAQALGVSPVYVEDALETMTQQGYLREENGRYLCTILLTEVTNELVHLSDRMYQEAAQRIAPDLIRALLESDVWSDEALVCHDTARALWALIPWCIATNQAEQVIPRSAVSTLRPDGANNLCIAAFSAPGAAKPALQEMMDGQFSGPCWNENDHMTLWQIDSVWSEHRIDEIYQDAMRTNLTLMQHVINGDILSQEEYALLAQRGLICTSGNPQELFTVSLLPVWLRGKAICEKLMRIADDVYSKHRDVLNALKKPYADALLADTPSHLHKLREYTLQDVYHDHWFIVHCLKTLVDMSLLRLPTQEERTSLHTIIITH